MKRQRTADGQTQGTPIERRSSARFPLTLEIRYTSPGYRSPGEIGTGRTIDLSSSGLKFSGNTQIPTCQRIVVYIDWPALLDGVVNLQLVIWGVMVRADGSDIALKTERHEFRTRRPGDVLDQEEHHLAR